MDKDLFTAVHEELIKELMEKKRMTYSEAYEATVDIAYLKMAENMTDFGDYLRKRAKEERG